MQVHGIFITTGASAQIFRSAYIHFFDQQRPYEFVGGDSKMELVFSMLQVPFFFHAAFLMIPACCNHSQPNDGVTDIRIN